MKKIIAGILGLALVAGVSTQAARAVFTTTGTVNGISINAGSASLTVGASVDPVSNLFDANLDLVDVYPGFGEANDQNATFVVKNTSTAGINLAIAASLTSATGWDSTGVDLKNYVEVAVNTADDSSGTGYHSLVDWNAGAIDFPGSPIAPDENRTYKVYVRVPSSAPDSIQGESLTDITFTLTGTQQ